VIDHGGANEARSEASFSQIVLAGAGTMIQQCTEYLREGGDLVASR
jgi:hypothetical protein